MVYKLLKTISSHPRVKPQPHAGKIVLKTTTTTTTTTTATTKRSKSNCVTVAKAS